MTTIDRYMLRQFLQVFLICWASLTGLYVVFDAFNNLDHFLRFSANEGNLGALMGRFYAYRTIYFFDRTSAMLALVAAMFTATWIQRHNELTALMAAGVSPRRVIKPIVLAAIGISVLAAVNRELIIPGLRNELSQDPRDLLGDQGQQLEKPQHDSSSILIQGRQTFANDQRIEKPRFLLPLRVDPKGRALAAANCFYQPANHQHQAGYLFRGVSEPTELLAEPALMLNGQPIVSTPRSSPEWLKPDECFVVSDLSFDDLTRHGSFRDFASVPQLIRGLHQDAHEFPADLSVQIHGRFVQPILDASLIFLGLPLVLTKKNRNIFVAIGQCVALVAVFMLVVMACQYFGKISWITSPALAAWLPVMIVVPAAVAMYERIET